MQAIIIDDELKARNTLRGLLDMVNVPVDVVAEGATVKEGVSIIEEHSSADILFLDIQLLDGSGFEIIRKVGNIKPLVVFTTAYEEYALEAFRNSAVDYLLKPISLDELSDSLKKVGRFKNSSGQNRTLARLLRELTGKVASRPRRITINSSNKLSIIDVDDIVYCGSDSSYSYVLLENGDRILSSGALKLLEEQLSEDGFFRVSNSHLVNLDKVKTLNKAKNTAELEMSNGEMIEVSRRKRTELVTLLTNR